MSIRCEISFGKSGINLNITGDDLELYALAKKLDDNATNKEEIINEEFRWIRLQIENSLEGRLIKE